MSANKWLLASVLHLTLVLASAPPITLNAGIVHGTTCSGAVTAVYRGIPFAEPPVGPLRFMPPQPMNTSFPGHALNATQFSSTCIQVPGEFDWSLPSTSEDCLTLTVYVPPGNMSGLPVKVWAHGGGDTAGSASYPLYDLCNLATDSVAVAVQYRLGPLGFLALGTAGIEGNMGIKDQVMALRWVQENIAAFGGDPKKVLLFGQSSGADDAFAIASLPQAKSLVSAVICESGGGLDLPPRQTMERVGADYASGLNCSSSDLACLQSRSVEELISVYTSLDVFGTGQGTFKNPLLSSWSSGDFPNATDMATPFLDGKFFVQQPLAVGPQVPIMLGSTTNDGSLFAVPPLQYTGETVAAYEKFLTQFKSLAPTVAKAYPLSLFNSSGSTKVAVAEALTYIETAYAFTCFTYRGLRSAKNSGVPAYAYSFAHTLSCPWLWYDDTAFPTKAELAVLAQPMHTAELPLVFGNLADQPWGNGTCNMTQDEYTLSAKMKASWTAMAASGNPSIPGLDWAPFDECSTKGLYIQNTATVQQLDFSACQFWDDIQHRLGGVEFSWPSNQTCMANGTTSTNTTTPSTSAGYSNRIGVMRTMLASLGPAMLAFLVAL